LTSTLAHSIRSASSCADDNYLSKSRFEYMRTKIRRMLFDVGFSKQIILSSVPIIPICGATGENIASPADKLAWWSDVWIGKGDLSACSVLTLIDALDRCVVVPRRHPELPLRVPISQCFDLKNVGMIVTGRVEQVRNGTLNPKP
jgi:elongation factor 1-alpha